MPGNYVGCSIDKVKFLGLSFSMTQLRFEKKGQMKLRKTITQLSAAFIAAFLVLTAFTGKDVPKASGPMLSKDPRYNAFIDSLKSDSGFQAHLDTLDIDQFIVKRFEEVKWQSGQQYNRILWDISNFANPNRHTDHRREIPYAYQLKNSTGFSPHLEYLGFDRIASKLKTLFNEKRQAFILDLFCRHYYNECVGDGVESLVKSLLQTYTEIGSNNELLDSLSLRADRIPVIEDDLYWELASEEVKKHLSENHSDDPWINAHTRYAWAYSFWVRRYREGNKEIVYSLLQTFDEAMSLYEYEH